ncbi:MAG: hypothetical protein ACR2MP_10390 [Streptosporangiaceae bacterium]
MTPGAGWTCEAYGPELVEAGALCFFAGLHERACASQAECSASMTAGRRQLFRRISEQAAAGSDVATFLDGKFSTPAQLLGGGQEAGQ